jgi:hypothetical protein
MMLRIRSMPSSPSNGSELRHQDIGLPIRGAMLPFAWPGCCSGAT